MRRSASIGRGAAVVVAVGAAVTSFATPALAGTSNGSNRGQHPPGNNGTVKIDESPADGGNGNDPHVGCQFSINFFGYDAGTQQATMVFEPWAPTNGGKTTTLSTSWTTASRNGGSQLDKSYGPVDLTSAFAGVTPAAQGYHVKLTVHVTGSQGSDVKHKVFWIGPCASPKPAATAPASASTPTAAPAAAPAAQPAPHTVQPVTQPPTAVQAATVQAPTVSAAPASVAALTVPPAEVLGERIVAAPAPASGFSVRPATAVPAAAAAGGTLPFTGLNAGTLVALAVSLIVLGGLAWLGTRWKAHRSQ